MVVEINPHEFVETLHRYSNDIGLTLDKLPLSKEEKRMLENRVNEYILKRALVSDTVRTHGRSKRIVRQTLMHFCVYGKTYDEATVVATNFLEKPDGISGRWKAKLVDVTLKEMKELLEQVKPSLFT